MNFLRQQEYLNEELPAREQVAKIVKETEKIAEYYDLRKLQELCWSTKAQLAAKDELTKQTCSDGLKNLILVAINGEFW